MNDPPQYPARGLGGHDRLPCFLFDGNVVCCTRFLKLCIHHSSHFLHFFLADRTNGRAYTTVLRTSSVVCNVMHCG